MGPLTLCCECSCPLPCQLHHTEPLCLAVGVAWLEMPGSFTASPKAAKDWVMRRSQKSYFLASGWGRLWCYSCSKSPKFCTKVTLPGKHILASFLLPWSAFFTPLLTFPLSFLNKLFTWKSLSPGSVSRECHLRQPHVVPWFPSQSFQLAPCYTRT